MGDKQLGFTTRLSVPNTLKESNMIAQAPANRANPNWKDPRNFATNKMIDRDMNSLTKSFSFKGPGGCKDPITASVNKYELAR